MVREHTHWRGTRQYEITPAISPHYIEFPESLPVDYFGNSWRGGSLDKPG